MFQQNKKSTINYGYINNQVKISESRALSQQPRLNLVIFDKNEGNFREKKMFQ